jgi:signal transduction histidine kinase
MLAEGRIFDAFTQADSSLRRAHQGLGLGLALCRRLSERLNGELTVQSELGQGSTFTFKVSVRQEES